MFSIRYPLRLRVLVILIFHPSKLLGQSVHDIRGKTSVDRPHPCRSICWCSIRVSGSQCVLFVIPLVRVSARPSYPKRDRAYILPPSIKQQKDHIGKILPPPGTFGRSHSYGSSRGEHGKVNGLRAGHRYDRVDAGYRVYSSLSINCLLINCSVSGAIPSTGLYSRDEGTWMIIYQRIPALMATHAPLSESQRL